MEDEGALASEHLFDSDPDILYFDQARKASTLLWSQNTPQANRLQVEVATSGVVDELGCYFSADYAAASFVGFYIDSGAARTVFVLRKWQAYVETFQGNAPKAFTLNHYVTFGQTVQQCIQESSAPYPYPIHRVFTARGLSWTSRSGSSSAST